MLCLYTRSDFAHNLNLDGGAWLAAGLDSIAQNTVEQSPDLP